MTIVIAALSTRLWLENPNTKTTDRDVPVGAVQSVLFFGNFGVQTQVDTRDEAGSDRNFVVNRIIDFRKDQAVVLHVRMFRAELGSVDRSTCEELLGSPQ